jgi:hypothetical protein
MVKVSLVTDLASQILFSVSGGRGMSLSSLNCHRPLATSPRRSQKEKQWIFGALREWSMLWSLSRDRLPKTFAWDGQNSQVKKGRKIMKCTHAQYVSSTILLLSIGLDIFVFFVCSPGIVLWSLCLQCVGLLHFSLNTKLFHWL